MTEVRETSGAVAPRPRTPARVVQCAYEAFNRGDFDAALALMCEDVDWHDTLTGRRRYGRGGVRRYWSTLTRSLIPRVEVLGLTRVTESLVLVDAHLLIYDPRGKLLAEQDVRHSFKLRGGLISRMDARSPRPAGSTPAGS